MNLLLLLPLLAATQTVSPAPDSLVLLSSPRGATQEIEEEESTSLLENLDLGFRTLEGGGLGVDFEWPVLEELELYGEFLGQDAGLLAEIELRGYLGARPASDDQTPRALEMSGNLFTTFDFGDVWGWKQSLDVGVTPIGFEADQSFDSVNYTMKPFVRAPIPLSPEIANAWNSLTEGLRDGKPQPAPPIYLSLRYAYVDAIEGRGGRSEEDRFELALSHRMILFREISLDTRYEHAFVRGDDRRLFDVALEYSMDDAKAWFVKFVSGELPISPRGSRSLSTGLAFLF